MSSDTAQADAAQDSSSLPVVRVPAPSSKADPATFFGIALTLILIAMAIFSSQSDASFLDIPSVLIVVLGTMTATCTAYTTDEILKTGAVIQSTFFRPARQPAQLARSLLDIASIARKRGLLALSAYEGEMRKEPFMAKGLGLVIDGYSAEDVDRMLRIEIDSFIERQKRAASMLRRASEIAPAMGLIGTLVGLVQMLSDLENPDTIGPAMAMALLTTFYGAIMGSIVLAPLSVKVEKSMNDEAQMMNMVLKTARSISNHENPRALEMALNGELSPSDQIRYFT